MCTRILDICFEDESGEALFQASTEDVAWIFRLVCENLEGKVDE
jgi:hypothetical protein